MSGFGIKPAWLADFQAYLRTRPVLRAVLWAVFSGLLVHVYFAVRGFETTPLRVAIEIVAWSIGAVVFYLIMRWWEANHAR